MSLREIIQLKVTAFSFSVLVPGHIVTGVLNHGSSQRGEERLPHQTGAYYAPLYGDLSGLLNRSTRPAMILENAESSSQNSIRSWLVIRARSGVGLLVDFHLHSTAR
jgi:hypothetical protein